MHEKVLPSMIGLPTHRDFHCDSSRQQSVCGQQYLLKYLHVLSSKQTSDYSLMHLPSSQAVKKGALSGSTELTGDHGTFFLLQHVNVRNAFVAPPGACGHEIA